MALSIDIPFIHAFALWAGGETIHEQGDLSKRYPLASVTRLCTAWSALVAAERGLCLLDDPVGPESSIIQHLLAYASDLPYESREPQFSVAKRRVYSNAGLEILGDVLEEVSGSPIERQIGEMVSEPLGMTTAEFVGSPVWASVAPIEDLLILDREMLEPTLISSELAQEVIVPQFPEPTGMVPGYERHAPCPQGLGIEIGGNKGPHWTGPSFPAGTVGYFGVSGSFLWVDRTHDATCTLLGTEEFGVWHKEYWNTMNEELLASILR